MITLCADIGGTSMRVALYDDDTEQERAEGPGEPMRTGRGNRLARQVATLVRPMLLRTRAVRADLLVVGASGAGRETERSELEAALDLERLAWRSIVTTDAELARAAAFAGGPGVLLIAGTGSIAVALDASGNRRRVGGLGWRMGDEGSGYWIGARALEAVGAMHDGHGMATHLAESLCTAARVPGIAGLIQWSAVAAPADVAALAPAVLECAAAGDQVAGHIRERAVRALVQLALNAGAGALPVAVSGGLLAHDRPLRDLVTTRLESGHDVTVVRRQIDPCRGGPALARAR